MNFIGCDSGFDAARAVLFGAPFDSTTSYRPGARFGSAAIRHESFGIETYSPYLDRDLGDCAIHDAGDLELPFGAPDPALKMIETEAARILAAGKAPVLLGGEHLVTLGAVRAARVRHPDLHILHFDAHADLRADYLGNPLSHACVMRRTCWVTGASSSSASGPARRRSSRSRGRGTSGRSDSPRKPCRPLSCRRRRPST